ncbi:MAG: hypothetical protein ACW99Q_05670 [Candidatus Kariarchaeaceae archaeon]|jgi:hypothetical protein
MVSTGKLAFLTILTVLGLGAIGGGFYLGNYVEDQIDQGIDSLVLSPGFKNDDPKDYADWLTNTDEDDTPKYRKFFFWNLTNPDAYLTGTTPVYEEIGPYSYRQYETKFDVAITLTEVTYKTYQYYVFDTATSDDGLSESDKIVNVNPAYIGTVFGAGSEAALVTGFVGPTVATIMDGLTTDFTDKVKVQGTAGGVAQVIDGLTTTFPPKAIAGAVPTALLNVQDGVTENLQQVVNATTSANVMFGNWAVVNGSLGVDTANNHFFNSTTFFNDWNDTVTGVGLVPGIKGVSDYIGSDLQYSNSTITKLLWDGPDGIPVPAVFDDFQTGTGVLAFLELYFNATNDIAPLSNGTLQGAYAASQGQLDAFAAYLSTYLILDNPLIEFATVSSLGPSQLVAAGMFLDQWANATYVPTGVDIDGDGSPDGVEAGYPSGIDAATAAGLWSVATEYSLTNSSGNQVWLGAIAGDPTAQAVIMVGCISL